MELQERTSEISLADVSPTPILQWENWDSEKGVSPNVHNWLVAQREHSLPWETGRGGSVASFPPRPLAPKHRPGGLAHREHPTNFSNKARVSFTAHAQLSEEQQILFSKSVKTPPPRPHPASLARKLVSTILGSPRALEDSLGPGKWGGGTLLSSPHHGFPAASS